MIRFILGKIPNHLVQETNFMGKKDVGRLKELDATHYSLAAINGVFAAGDKIGEITQDLARRAEMPSRNVNDFRSMMDQRMDDIVNHKAVSDRIAMAAASPPVWLQLYDSPL